MVEKEDKEFAVNGKQKGGVREETNAVSGMRVTIVHKNQTTMPPHLLSHLCHEVEVCRGKEVSEAKVTIVPYFDNRADTIWKVLARDRLVNSGILPSVHFYKTETGCKAVDKCAFPHQKVDEQPNQKANKGFFPHKRRESDDKNAVAIVKNVPRMGCVSQDSDALVS